jgi:hypothetical protein
VVMHRLLTIATIASAFVCPSEAFAQEDPCAAPVEPFNGYWGGAQVQVSKRVAGIPVLATARFSYREIRYSPCTSGKPVLPPGIGEASVMVGVPLFNNRRGGWLLQMAAQGQGSQKPGDPVGGAITGAPATAGHLNLWETPLPLIQLTGAASAAIVPRSSDVPLSIAYLGGLLDETDDGGRDRSRAAPTPSPSFDLVRSPSEAAPPTQTAWEMTL